MTAGYGDHMAELSTPLDPTEREFDIALFGGTGFVGRLVAQHLTRFAPGDARIAVAARSADKLQALLVELGPRAADWTPVVADADDPAQMTDLAGRTRVVATTVGPYAKYGTHLVRACAEQGTHYADLSGETLFVRGAIDTLQETAQRTGALIVPSCGFDSIPSDLGVLQLANTIAADDEGEPGTTTLVVTAMRGGLSGGTVDSMVTQFTAVANSPTDRDLVDDPYSLSPDRDKEPDFGKQPDFGTINADEVSPTLRGKLAPFFMASYNTRVVRRSNALSNYRYGRAFRYRESMAVGSSRLSTAAATAVALGIRAGMVGWSIGPVRPLLKRLLPGPGTGPSEATRNRGHFTIDVFTTTSTGAHYRSRVAAKGDPGYLATSVMLGESALALAFDHQILPALEGGVLTPATALGTALIDRLRERDFRFAVERLHTGSATS